MFITLARTQESICVNTLSLPSNVSCLNPGYFSCDDGTCVDPPLVCDGAHAKMKVSVKQRALIHQIVYTVLTRLVSVLSGGCIPVGEMCDGVNHCNDKSE